ncbi:MAG TPA: hypothetical protein VJL29_15740 [Thermoguttaceae bacterium]|nr:hypothetical protein [Thermoguttaceae bacterium]
MVRSADARRRFAAMLGVGFDAEPGQVRLTRGKNFALVGGSEETHSVMQETVVKINEHIDREGKRLEDLTAGEVREICRRVGDSINR